MSDSWDIRCLDCHDTLDVGDGRATVEKLRVEADAVADLADLLVRVSGVTGRTSVLDGIDVVWFAKHRGHSLAVVDQNGRFPGQCPFSTRCAFGDKHWCQLQAGHEGEHGPKERA